MKKKNFGWVQTVRFINLILLFMTNAITLERRVSGVVWGGGGVQSEVDGGRSPGVGGTSGGWPVDI